MASPLGQLQKRCGKFSKHLPWPQPPSGTQAKGICHTSSGQQDSRLGTVSELHPSPPAAEGAKTLLPTPQCRGGIVPTAGNWGEMSEGEPALRRAQSSIPWAGFLPWKDASGSAQLAPARAQSHPPSPQPGLASG